MYHGSNTMWLKYCTKQGKLQNGRRTDGQELKPGTAVFTYNTENKKRGHVGLYIGNGWVIEAQGPKAGVVKSRVTLAKWVEWGELIRVDYGDGSAAASTGTSSTNTKTSSLPKYKTYPTIRRGDRGELVTQLQRLLSRDGSSLQIDVKRAFSGPVSQVLKFLHR